MYMECSTARFNGLRELLAKDAEQVHVRHTVIELDLDRQRYFPALKHMVRVIVQDTRNDVQDGTALGD